MLSNEKIAQFAQTIVVAEGIPPRLEISDVIYWKADVGFERLFRFNPDHQRVQQQIPILFLVYR